MFEYVLYMDYVKFVPKMTSVKTFTEVLLFYGVLLLLPKASNDLHIAQIAPLSFQGSHRTQTQTSEVRWLHASVVTEWSPACLHMQFQGDHHRGN